MADVIATLKSIDVRSFASDIERKKAVAEVHALLSRIESPSDTGLRLCLTYPVQLAGLKIMIDLGLFREWMAKNNGGKTSGIELSKLVSCDTMLFLRTLRHLAATNMLWVDEDGLYEMTPFAARIVTHDHAAYIDCALEFGLLPALHMPTFLKHNEYRNPTGGKNDSFMHYKHMSAWEYLGSNPAAAESFNRFMRASSAGRGHFSDVYPAGDLGCEAEQVLIVDIGGSVGHDLQLFKKRHPDAVGRMILQDQADVIETAKKDPTLSDSIEKQAYDFFTPQPIIGAKIYLLRAVLHDWPDTEAKRILDNIRPALKKGYSKLLVNEVVIPTERPNVEETTRDLTMMSLASGVERTEEHWKELIGTVGLKIIKIWRSPLYAESVIEVELA